ncbi:MAG: hypothetical protein RM368_30320 [Nostoc sp. DedSLP03]|nr:hypothetical protein [Nostoc sp. DedSLP03]MDZ7969195.1 hypothetical protein [Nostoc sp. DedSLP03]
MLEIVGIPISDRKVRNSMAVGAAPTPPKLPAQQQSCRSTN